MHVTHISKFFFFLKLKFPKSNIYWILSHQYEQNSARRTQSIFLTWAARAVHSLKPTFPVPARVLTLLLAGSSFLIWNFTQTEIKIKKLALIIHIHFISYVINSQQEPPSNASWAFMKLSIYLQNIQQMSVGYSDLNIFNIFIY